MDDVLRGPEICDGVDQKWPKNSMTYLMDGTYTFYLKLVVGLLVLSKPSF